MVAPRLLALLTLLGTARHATDAFRTAAARPAPHRWRGRAALAAAALASPRGVGAFGVTPRQRSLPRHPPATGGASFGAFGRTALRMEEDEEEEEIAWEEGEFAWEEDDIAWEKLGAPSEQKTPRKGEPPRRRSNLWYVARAKEWELDRAANADSEGVKEMRATIFRPCRPSGEQKQTIIIEIGEGVVVKKVRARSEPQLRSMENEATALNKFSGGDVVRLLTVSRKTEGLAAVFDFYFEAADGTLMNRVIQRAFPPAPKRLPFEQKVRIFVEILRGLTKVHEAGWVHRDVKPENVLIFGDAFACDGMHAKIADFGSAVPVDAIGVEDEDAYVGSPLYMAPEAWTGGVDAAKLDVWSAGMLGFELFTGGIPAELRAYATTKRTVEHSEHPLGDFWSQGVDVTSDRRFKVLEQEHGDIAGLIKGMLSRSLDERPKMQQAYARAMALATARGIEVPEQD